MDVVKPFLLDGSSMVEEEILIRRHEKCSDLLKTGLKAVLILLQNGILLTHEVIDFVQLLLDLSEDGGLNLLHFVTDLTVPLLEDLDLVQSGLAIVSALDGERLGIAIPAVETDTSVDELVKLSHVLLEERLLPVIDHVHDVVVVAYNQHHILTEDSELVLLGAQSGELDGHVD